MNFLQIGDLLRAERKAPGSEYGELIEHHITNGTIVPVAITCSLLVRAMKVRSHKCFTSKFCYIRIKRNKLIIKGFDRSSKSYML